MTANKGETECTIHLPHLGVSPEESSPFGIKVVAFELPDNTQSGVSLSLSIDKYGIDKVVSIMVFEHSTTDSIIITPTSAGTSFTSSVSGKTLTIAFPSTTPGSKKRVAVVWGV